MARGDDEGGDFIPPTPKPGSREHRERWKGREKGARRGHELKRRLDRAKVKQVKQPRDDKGKGKGCAVTAIAAVGAATVATLRARGWLG